jgi:hypothetical protein
MGHSKLALSFTAAAAVTILLAGCAGGSSTGPVVGTGLTPTMSQALADVDPIPLAPCVKPFVWASWLTGRPVFPAPGYPRVQGYQPPGGAKCGAAISGVASPGGAFVAPFGLASDSADRLYVADVNVPGRVVVFNNPGVYLATLTSSPGFQPLGVCVSPNGTVGVADRSATGGAGDVEFFTNGLANFAAPTGFATGGAVVNTFHWCAFDRRGNFFADGTTAGPSPVQAIVYIPLVQVNRPAASGIVVSNPLLSTVPYWVSMYVQLKDCNTNGEVLAVADLKPEIQYFKINAITGRPGPPLPAMPLVAYPVNHDNMDQMAPDASQPKATIYFADYGLPEIAKTTQCVGNVAPFNFPPANVKNPVGIATIPTGQY